MKNAQYTSYHYDSVYLLPQKSIVNSRAECDTSVFLGNYKFSLPTIPSNMKSVVDQDTCLFLHRHKMMYIMHRFDINMVDFSRYCLENKMLISLSIGINEDSYDGLRNLLEQNIKPDFLTLDVANSWSDKSKKMIDFVKKEFSTFLIVGNVATADASKAMADWGADAIKVGIAGGKVCITKNKTGFHVPMATSVEHCANAVSIPVIADGGVVEHGDIAKAIALGARMVMCGSLFSGYDQSAGKLFEMDGKHYKEYFGSASEHNKGQYKNVEGKKILISYRGDMNKLLDELKEDLQSSISYSGGKTLEDLKGCPMTIVGCK